MIKWCRPYAPYDHHYNGCQAVCLILDLRKDARAHMLASLSWSTVILRVLSFSFLAWDERRTGTIWVLLAWDVQRTGTICLEHQTRVLQAGLRTLFTLSNNICTLGLAQSGIDQFLEDQWRVRRCLLACVPANWNANNNPDAVHQLYCG
jgi:hypothetical protein